jgi:hypothetical protein
MSQLKGFSEASTFDSATVRSARRSRVVHDIVLLHATVTRRQLPAGGPPGLAFQAFASQMTPLGLGIAVPVLAAGRAPAPHGNWAVEAE